MGYDQKYFTKEHNIMLKQVKFKSRNSFNILLYPPSIIFLLICIVYLIIDICSITSVLF